MRQFLIVFCPEGRADGGVYESRQGGWAVETVSFKAYIDQNMPICMSFTGERERDRMLSVVAQEFPGRKFAACTVTGMAQATPGPVKMFTVDARGVLPA